VAPALSTTDVQAAEWSAKDVSLGDVIRALDRLRNESAGETDGPDMRTSVMTHLAWVPSDWQEAAVGTLAGLGERHPSRGVLLFPEPSASDGIDAKVSVLAFPLSQHRSHIAAEVIELHLRGSTTQAPASVVMPLLVTGLPVFLRWRGRPSFGEQPVEQLVDLCDRFIVDSAEWPDVPGAYRDLPFERTACSDIAWRRTEPWRRSLAGLWPEIKDARELKVLGPVAEASLLAGWLRARLEHDMNLTHEEAKELESVSVESGPCPPPREHLSGSDLLSAELDEFGRDPIYEAAALAATG
jgi:Glucose-6-phosphate dehydrogenase subunit